MEIFERLFSWIFFTGEPINTLASAIILIIGLAGLYFGAEFLIRGGANLALAAGVKKVVVGLTVVAFGTSLPEMVVSVTSTLSNEMGIALGNVVGSNIANIALVLGIAAIIRPVEVENVVIKFDMWIVLGATVLFMLMFTDGIINFFEGIVLLVAFAGYMIIIFTTAKEHHIAEEVEEAKSSPVINIILLILGLAVLTLGSQFTVKGAVAIATEIGVSPLIIGLTIIAIGTSLPELATAIVAQIRKEADITVGNLIGSNIFNILFVIGVAASVSPFVTGNPANDGLKIITNDGTHLVPNVINTTYMPIMLAVALILLPFLFSNKKVTRGEGIILLLGYIAYIAYITISGSASILT
jgi:cation:H+ antiporter